MSDEEIVRDGINEGTNRAAANGLAALDRILSERDSLRAALKQRAAASAERVQMDGETIASLRAALERIAAEGPWPWSAIARQALTSSEKETVDPGVIGTVSATLQQLQQTTSSDATLHGEGKG